MAEKPLIDNPEDIRLNEFGEIQQILGHPPGWMLRWGISMVFIAIAILLTMGWLINYPDVIPARAVVFTENPIIRVKAPSQGKITELLVSNGQLVEKDQLLVILENPAKKQDIDQLQALLFPFAEEININDLEELELPKGLELGNLQTTYSRLNQQLETLQFNLSQRSASKRIAALRNQKANLRRLNGSLMRQIDHLQKERDLAKGNLVREEKLRSGGASSDVDVENAQAEFLRAERALENSNTNLINNQLAIDKLDTQILDLRESDVDQKNKEFVAVKEDINLLLSEIEVWKLSFLIEAPISGKVSMSEALSAQQFINANEEVMSIVPVEGTGRILGKAELSTTGMGKIEEGMKVQLRLDGYPYKEFGMVIGEVGSISDAKKENAQGQTSYELLIELPDTLRTTYDKKLEFRQEMEATAQIITKSRSILSRIFDNLRNLSEHQM